MTENRVAALGLLLLIDFVLAVVMLVTDKNLQTDFGAQSPYYLHWYGVLVMGVVDLLLALVLLAFSSLPVLTSMSASVRRGVVIGALAWAALAIVAMLAIVATYGQVGFSTASQFAQYLFSVTPYPGALSYIPWFYDLTLAMYVVTAAVGALATRQAPSAPSTPAVS